jgi:hypothetical protein
MILLGVPHGGGRLAWPEWPAISTIPTGLREKEDIVNTPPAQAGGFGLRLTAGSIGHSAD